MALGLMRTAASSPSSPTSAVTNSSTCTSGNCDLRESKARPEGTANWRKTLADLEAAATTFRRTVNLID